MKTRIIHLSDLHIGKTGNGASGAEAKTLKKIVNRIVEDYGKGNKPIVIITGDVVDDGDKAQIELAREILNPLYENGFRVWPIPGNHDYGWNGNHAEEKRFVAFKDAFFPNEQVGYPHVDEINGHLFVGLNSMKAEVGFWDGLLADGELGPKQINDLLMFVNKFAEKRAKDKTNAKIVAFLHHHPFIFPDDVGKVDQYYEKAFHQLKDGDDFMNKISKVVDVLLFGHDHYHQDFSGTIYSRKYGVEKILSSGMSTVPSPDYKVDDAGKRKSPAGPKRLLGRLITLPDLTGGNIDVETIYFD